MKPVQWGGLLAAAVAVVLSAQAMGPARAQTHLTLKSASAESSYYVMVVQLAEMIREASGGDVIPTVEESQGSVQNVREAGRRPGAFLFTTPPSLLQSAVAGKPPFEDTGGEYGDIRTLFPMPFVTIHFVVRADSGIETVRDLAGHTFIAGGTGTFCHERSMRILEALNLADEVDTPDMELSGAPAAIRNQQAVGYVTCSAHPTPQLQELGTMVDLKILSFTPEELEVLMGMPGTGPVTIAADTYAWLNEDVDTVGVPVGAYAVNLDDAAAKLIVEQFWTQREKLAKENPWWAGVTPELTAQLWAPLHPGAAGYYDSAGVDLPDHMQP